MDSLQNTSKFNIFSSPLKSILPYILTKSYKAKQIINMIIFKIVKKINVFIKENSHS